MISKFVVSSRLLAVIILSITPTVQGIEVWGYFPIQDGDDYDKVEAYDTDVCPGSTNVDMTGGHVGNVLDADSGMFMYNCSTLNVSGGTIEFLHTYDSSTANISGGIVTTLSHP